MPDIKDNIEEIRGMCKVLSIDSEQYVSAYKDWMNITDIFSMLYSMSPKTVEDIIDESLNVL